MRSPSYSYSVELEDTYLYVWYTLDVKSVAASILRAQIPNSRNTKDTESSRHELCSNRYQLPSACRAVIDGVGSVGTAILGVIQQELKFHRQNPSHPSPDR